MKFTERIQLAWQTFKAMRFPKDYSYGGTGWLWNFFRGSGKEINYQAEIGDLSKLRQSSLVMTAVTWVGLRFPEAPPAVFTIDSQGKAKEEVGHVITKALRRPNPFYSGKVLSKTVALNWIMSGNVYWRVLSNSAGEPLEIWPIPFWMIEPRSDSPTEYVGWYDYVVDGRHEALDIEEIIHFRDGIDPYNPRKGMSPLWGLLREIYTDNEIGNFAASLMTNSGVPEFILVPKEGAVGLTPQEQTFLKEQFEASRSGANKGKAILASRGLEIQRLTFEPNKLDLSSLRDIPESRLASVIGIPASALGLNIGIKNNTYSNAKELGEDATEGYLVPLWAYFADELTAYFQDRGLLKENQEIRYKLAEVRALQEDKTEQFERNSIAVEGDWMKISEARADAGLPVEPEDEVYLSERKAAQVQIQTELNMEMQAQRMEQQAQNGNMNGGMNGEDKDEPPAKALISDWSPSLNQLARMRRNWRKLGPKKDLYQRGNGHAA